jgi:hypothetical protein
LKRFNALSAVVLGGLVAVWLVVIAPVASAQRVQFPTMVEQGAVAPPVAQAAPPPTWTVPGQPMTTAPLTTAPPAAATPPAFDPYAMPGAAPAPGAYSPYAPSPYAPAPYAGAPYSTTPGYLYPEGIESPAILPPNQSFFSQPLRFFQEADGPITAPPTFADLPPNTYDAYLDAAWYPQITSWLSAQVGARVGAYTDFNTFSTESIRVMGRGLGVISLTPKFQVALGVVYIDRLLIKLFPAGGIIWIPNPDARYEFLFPNPKLARRITTLGNTDIWLYGFGEYGGGSWTAQRVGMNDQFDYNDIRFGGGLESFGYRGLHGLFEVAYVFNRQILYRSGTPNFYPSDTVMLRAGIAY